MYAMQVVYCLHRTCSSWDFSGPEENMAMDRKRNDNTASRVSFPPHCYICVRWVSSSYTCRLCPSSNILGRQKKGGPNWTKACRTFSFSLGELWRIKSLTACTRPQTEEGQLASGGKCSVPSSHGYRAGGGGLRNSHCCTRARNKNCCVFCVRKGRGSARGELGESASLL